MRRSCIAPLVLAVAAIGSIACATPPIAPDTEGKVVASIVTDCTSNCPANVPIDGVLVLMWGGDNPTMIGVMPALESTDAISIVDRSQIISLTMFPGDMAQLDFQFECDPTAADGQGTIVGNGTARNPYNFPIDIVAATAQIRCDGSGGVDPATADMRGLVELNTRRYPGRTPNANGQLLAFDKSGVQQVRFNFRDRALADVIRSPGTCAVETPFPAVPAAVTVSPSPVWPAADGGAPLTFLGPFNFPDPAAVQPGRRFDAVIAAQAGFDGVDADNLVQLPAVLTGLVAGTELTDGNLMGHNQPGNNLGGFSTAGTTRPSFSWIAPAKPAAAAAAGVSAIDIRVIDFHIGTAGPPLVIHCAISPTATTWTMDEATFAMLDPSTASNINDNITMDLSFINVAATPSGDGAFVSLTSFTQGNIFFQKLP